MSKFGFKYFLVGGTVVDGTFSGASDFTTDALNLSSFQDAWLLYANSTYTTGAPTFTIQVSDDESVWFDYNERTTDVLFNRIVKESVFYPKFMRLVYKANSADGNVYLKLAEIG